jgi:hypothetical protein
MSAVFAALTVLFVVLLVGAGVAWLFARGERARFRETDEKHRALPARRIVFKICPDCAELVYLDAPKCKYCGCALVVGQSPNE